MSVVRANAIQSQRRKRLGGATTGRAGPFPAPPLFAALPPTGEIVAGFGPLLSWLAVFPAEGAVEEGFGLFASLLITIESTCSYGKWAWNQPRPHQSRPASPGSTHNFSPGKNSPRYAAAPRARSPPTFLR